MSSRRALPVALALVLVVLLSVGIWLISATPGTLLNEQPSRRLGPAPATQPEVVAVQVAEGDNSSEIGSKLEDAGVIESARLFRVLASLMGLEEELEAGDYEFLRGETALAAVRRISRGETSALRVTIPEGLRSEEVAELLERQGVVSAQDFLSALNEAYDASFLAELPPDAGLEGFLFPATYGFSLQTSAHDAVQQMLAAFDERYREQIQPGLAPLSLRDVVTLASIIEREARVPEDRPLIASVFLNRLALGMRLDADPTVQYAVANDPASVQQFGYWKRELTVADYQVSSPYNTYVNAGLPPGPIANPGLDSILAVLQPAETDFLYFVARLDGSHVFSETFAEHQRNICEIYPERSEC
jgi:UPF0755 protein